MSYTITKELDGKVLVQSTTLPPYYIPSTCLVRQTVNGVEIQTPELDLVGSFTPDDITEIDDGSTQTNPTTPTELFNSLKTVFKNGGTSPLTTAELSAALSKITGVTSYSDNQYSAASPFTILANTDTVLPNNAGVIYDEQKTRRGYSIL